MLSQHMLHMKLLHEIFRIILDHPNFFQDNLFLLMHFLRVKA